MLQRPSTRRQSHQTRLNLNLIPMLDTLVTLIGFLLITSTGLSLVSLESEINQQAQDTSEASQSLPLQLTLTLKPHRVEISSPFSKIKTQSLPYEKSELPWKEIKTALKNIKASFPQETTLILIPEAKTSYQTLITLMDLAQGESDPHSQDPSQKAQASLFPHLVFAPIQSESPPHKELDPL